MEDLAAIAWNPSHSQPYVEFFLAAQIPEPTPPKR
jgi:hypothetical protein